MAGNDIYQEYVPHHAQNYNQCKGPTNAQLGLLFMSLGFLTIGATGIRSCSVPFGVDQFDASTDEDSKGINSFFNWHYLTFIIVTMVAITVK
ncbi:hypothetical protein IFM89_035880 [Coptis chinensis]|uniref:Uncharacterized protein n=1 Tax=Coptis chinensis TaxID=261450 RepID=A0A835H2Q9_9MAGN|nr:hypothetical protein IFM89_035880 [Coptis chinensis]